MNLLTLLLLQAALAVASPVEQAPLRSSPSPETWPKPLPLLGFGTWNLRDNTAEAVSWAIQAGYRHIDCAAIYGNEAEVGNGIVDGLAKTGLSREHLWITSKLWNDHHHPNRVRAALDQSLHHLRVEYLDLYHMHWPVADTWFGGHEISYRNTWGAMTLLLDTGKVRNIGVSNFSPEQLEALLAHATTPPAVHQMEMHPYLQQDDWLEWHRKQGIAVTAYSPLGGTNPTYDQDHEELAPLLNNTVVDLIAGRQRCTPAQVVLAWGMRRGVSVIPKSNHRDHIQENVKSVECELTERDMKELRALGDARQRYNNPSKSWGLELFRGLEDWDGKHGPAD